MFYAYCLICFDQSNLIGWGRATAEGGLVLSKDIRSSLLYQGSSHYTISTAQILSMLYGHMTDTMKKASADRMQVFIDNLQNV